MDKNEFIIKSKDFGLKLTGEYNGFSVKTEFKCDLCGKKTFQTPRSVLAKTKKGCRTCSTNRMSNSEFIDKMNQKNPNIEILSEYKDSKFKVLCRCKKDGYEWWQRPNDLLMGIGCLKCSKRIKMTHDDFIEEFRKLCNKPIRIMSKYKNHRTPLLCECKIDGFQWNAYPYDLLHNKTGCLLCGGVKIYNKETLVSELNKINDSIEILGDYINSQTPILCKCLNCQNEWSATPSNLLYGETGCPNCNLKVYKMENIVEKYLIQNNIPYIKYKKFDELLGVGGKPLSYDFYILNTNILIECQGLQHYKSIDYFGGDAAFKVQQEHDLRKKQYAQKNGYTLIEILYSDSFERINHILSENLIKRVI